MTHISEDDFQEIVREHLEETLGPIAISIADEVWLPKVRGRADFWVAFPGFILAIEVENDAGSIRPGCAQAIEYASVHDDAIPVVYVPEGHNDHATAEVFRNRGVIIKELET